jgi:hypothetical protein
MKREPANPSEPYRSCRAVEHLYSADTRSIQVCSTHHNFSSWEGAGVPCAYKRRMPATQMLMGAGIVEIMPKLIQSVLLTELATTKPTSRYHECIKRIGWLQMRQETAYILTKKAWEHSE